MPILFKEAKFSNLFEDLIFSREEFFYSKTNSPCWHRKSHKWKWDDRPWYSCFKDMTSSHTKNQEVRKCNPSSSICIGNSNASQTLWPSPFPFANHFPTFSSLQLHLVIYLSFNYNFLRFFSYLWPWRGF